MKIRAETKQEYGEAQAEKFKALEQARDMADRTLECYVAVLGELEEGRRKAMTSVEEWTARRDAARRKIAAFGVSRRVGRTWVSYGGDLIEIEGMKEHHIVSAIRVCLNRDDRYTFDNSKMRQLADLVAEAEKRGLHWEPTE